MNNLSGGVMVDVKNKGLVYWFTGLSGSGKSTIALELSKRLVVEKVVILDPDIIRNGLCKDLGFSMEDRTENLRRIAEVAKIFSDNGVTVIVACITPTEKDRKNVSSIIGECYRNIFIYCPIEVCEERDVKGLYKKARAGEIKDFTGISSPFVPPLDTDMCVETDNMSVDECVDIIMSIH